MMSPGGAMEPGGELDPVEERRYRGKRIDGGRFDRFPFRPGDVIVATPSKCGTTWMQSIVVRLLRGRAGLDVPIGVASPWLDIAFDGEDELFARLAAEPGPRVVKTHAPLDGVPQRPGVAIIAVTRHPLDAALSDVDHTRNTDEAGVAAALGASVTGEDSVADAGEVTATATDTDTDTDGEVTDETVIDPATELRRYLAADTEPFGTGPRSLVEYAWYVRQMWVRRHRPGVHLFHYQDLWDDLPGQVARVADIVGVERAVADEAWPELTLDAMRSRSSTAAPEAHRGFWHDARNFFPHGGRRNWAELLDGDEVRSAEQHLAALLHDLDPDDLDRGRDHGRDHDGSLTAADWALHGGRL